MINTRELKSVRILRGIPQNKLARILKITPATLCMKENGNRPFTLAEVQGLANVLELNKDQVWNIFFENNLTQKESEVPDQCNESFCNVQP